MKYENYKEEFLEKQVELVNEVTKDWEEFGYPNAEQLKEAYGREGFTPETRHYIFDDENNLVGLLASAVEQEVEGIKYGSIQYPFVKEGEYKSKVEKKLMHKAMETLKEKGVEVVYTRVFEKWPAKDFLKSFNYEKKGVVSRRAHFDLTAYDFSKEERPEYIMDFDWDKHIDAFYEAATKTTPFDREGMEEIVKRAEENEYHIKRLVIMKDGKMFGQGRVSINPNNEATLITFIYEEGKEKYRVPLLKELMKIARGHEKDPKMAYTFQFDNDTGPEKGYEGFDFEFMKTYRFEIDLK